MVPARAGRAGRQGVRISGAHAALGARSRRLSAGTSYGTPPGVRLLLYHFLIWSLWTLVATLAVNLIAIYLGSSAAFAVVAGFQAVCVALLTVANQFEESPDVYIALLRANPVTCLVLSWQQSRFEGQGYGIYFEDSLAGIVAAALLIAVLGAAVVKKHDLLVNNAESAGG